MSEKKNPGVIGFTPDDQIIIPAVIGIVVVVVVIVVILTVCCRKRMEKRQRFRRRSIRSDSLQNGTETNYYRKRRDRKDSFGGTSNPAYVPYRKRRRYSHLLRLNVLLGKNASRKETDETDVAVPSIIVTPASEDHLPSQTKQDESNPSGLDRMDRLQVPLFVGPTRY